MGSGLILDCCMSIALRTPAGQQTVTSYRVVGRKWPQYGPGRKLRRIPSCHRNSPAEIRMGFEETGPTMFNLKRITFHYRWQWMLRSSVESLWDYVTDTDRVREATAFPAAGYTY